ncbi:hypothetical protein ACLB2K_071610 [Fragaria x ananassa]
MVKNTDRKFFVGGHWRCHGTQRERDKGPEGRKRADDKVTGLVNSLNDGKVTDVVEVVVCPTDVFLPLVKRLLRSDFQIGSQNFGLNNCNAVNFSSDDVDVGCWVMKIGAPGEVSVEMLTKLEVLWVILGHSEKRNAAPTLRLLPWMPWSASHTLCAAGGTPLRSPATLGTPPPDTAAPSTTKLKPRRHHQRHTSSCLSSWPKGIPPRVGDDDQAEAEQHPRSSASSPASST